MIPNYNFKIMKFNKIFHLYKYYVSILCLMYFIRFET